MKQNKTTKPEISSKHNLNERTHKLINFDNEIRNISHCVLCGVDEAGRGPIAGPVVAAAVIFGDDAFIEGVFDSKQVSQKKREQLYDEIINSARSYGIGIVHSGEIDTMNILNATKQAMNIAISKLSEMPGIIIADGNFYTHTEGEVKNIVKADEKSFSVAAASILAKVTRDRIMCEFQNRYPNYSFSSHKGYGTTAHIDEIIEHGYTEIHRRSFKLKAVQGVLF
jgi:ribonuclease HII